MDTKETTSRPIMGPITSPKIRERYLYLRLYSPPSSLHDLGVQLLRYPSQVRKAHRDSRGATSEGHQQMETGYNGFRQNIRGVNICFPERNVSKPSLKGLKEAVGNIKNALKR